MTLSGWTALRLCGVAAMATATTEVLVARSSLRSGLDSDSALCFALCLVAFGILTDSLRDPPLDVVLDARFSSRLGQALAFSLGLAAIEITGLHAVAAVFGAVPAARQSIAPLACGVFAASFGGTGAVFLLAAHWGDSARAKQISVCALGVLATAPLWGGPIAASSSAPRGLASLLVSLSPVTHLAVFAQRDYLVTQWFYARSQLGSLAIDYPDPVLVAAAYLAIGLLGLAVGARLAIGQAGSTSAR